MIHRFGKLGGNNAIKLGLEQHLECLEKPLTLSENHLFDTYTVCLNVVLVVNNYLFKKVLLRILDDTWTWDLRKDKKIKEYFDVFYSNQKPNLDISDLNECYQKLRELKRNSNRGRRN